MNTVFRTIALGCIAALGTVLDLGQRGVTRADALAIDPASDTLLVIDGATRTLVETPLP